MSGADAITQLFQHARAGFGGLWVETQEVHFFLDRLFKECDDKKVTLLCWDAANGVQLNSFAKTLIEHSALDVDNAAEKPGAFLRRVPQLHAAYAAAAEQALGPPHKAETHRSFLVLVNFDHPALLDNQPMFPQLLQNLAYSGRNTRLTTVVLSTSAARIPPAIRKDYAVITHNLPDGDELQERLSAVAVGPLALSEPEQERVIAAARGLTRTEAENAFALSAVQHKAIRADAVWELKAGMVRNGGLMEIHSGRESFDDMGGLNHLRDFCTKLLTPKADKPTPRGLLLLGVPGAGKSQAAKCLATLTQRKLITLNLGNLFSKWQGETDKNVRQALATVDAMAPVILLCDEIDKQLAGSTGSGESDGGSGTRVFGTLLTWLNDHTSDVFFVGTCNDVRRIPAAFSRAERFDGVFFFDVPDADTRTAIWRLYLKKYGQKAEPAQLAEYIHFSAGWTGAEIKACCRLAATLGETITASAKKIVPVSRSDRENLTALRAWASNQCLSVDVPGLYKLPANKTLPASNSARQIQV